MLTRSSLTIRLHPNDDVVIARAQLVGGTTCSTKRSRCRASFRRATRSPRVRSRPDSPFAATTRSSALRAAILPGEHVHLNNLAMGAFDRDYAFGADVKPTQYASPPATFDGIVRTDGRVATRNYIGILSTVNCSATVARGVAGYFSAGAACGVSTSTAWSR
jgi:altronate hydrolase